MSDTTAKPQFRAMTTMRPVVGTTTDGDVWVGTEGWLVRRDASDLREPTGGSIDVLVGGEFAEPLQRVLHGQVEVFGFMWGTGTCRLYERQDGITVWLDDAIVTEIERWTGAEDEEHDVTPNRDLVLRQKAGRWSPIGFFDGELLAAMAMPLRGINGHLTDGAGRAVGHERYA